MTHYLDALRVMLQRSQADDRVDEFLEALARITMEAQAKPVTEDEEHDG